MRPDAPRADVPRPKVAFFSDARYPGGAERYLEILAEGLGDAFDFTFLLAREPGLGELTRRLSERGIRFLDYAPLRRFDGMVSAASGIRRAAPDLLHVNLPSAYDYACSMVAPVARMAGVRAVVTTEHLPAIGRSRRRAFWKEATAPAIDRVLTVSEANRIALVERHRTRRDKIEVIANGVAEAAMPSDDERAEARRSLRIPEPGLLCLSVGALTERKGQRDLLEAWRSPALRDAGALLALVGTGEDELPLRERARETGIGERVHFLGARSDMDRIYAAADLFLLPSRLEGMPFVLLEAMMRGIPAVASRIGGVDEVIEPGRSGILIPPGDATAIVDAVGEMIRNEKERRRLGTAGRERVRSAYRREEMLARTAALYRSVLESSPTGTIAPPRPMESRP